MLPYDVCRCKTILCPKRLTCQRNVDLNNLGPRTPVSYSLCNHESDDWTQSEFKSYIPISKEE
jgi:hypothetical protein